MALLIDIIILAAGAGVRMQSERPKVLHTIAGKPLLAQVLQTLHTLQAQIEVSFRKVHIIHGYKGEQVREVIENIPFTQKLPLNWVYQTQQLGTAHAVRQALPMLAESGVTLVLYGDVPFVSAETIKQVLQQAEQHRFSLLTAFLDDPQQYGRIIRTQQSSTRQSAAQGDVIAIVEYADADAKERYINEINTGIMAVHTEYFKRWLSLVGNQNRQLEYYLTDIVQIAVQHNIVIQTINPKHNFEISGVNTQLQLSELERQYQYHYAVEYLQQGLKIIDPRRFDLRGILSFGSDCEIDINCIIDGEVVLGDAVTIGANCILKNCNLGDGVTIHPNSMIEGSVVEQGANVGPFARLRSGTHLETGAKVGNFVETKNTRMGQNSKANHLAYVGDAQVGRSVNIGAGTITCNYDGANKHQTVLGDDVFIGSNSALIAPVTIGKGATIGAGSTISADVADGELGLERSKQLHKSNWKRPTKSE